jgi:hypothetical protein
MRRLGWLACVVAAAACAHAGAKVRPGPALHVGFAPPPGLAQLEISRQERTSEVRYPGRDPVAVRETIRTSQREAWTALPGGAWRLVSMQMDEDATRDGQPVASAVPLIGVPFVTVVDGKGAFVRAEDVADSVRQVEERIASPSLRRMVAPLLTPALVTSRLEAAWEARTKGLCGRAFTPGEVFYGVDRQELPAGGPALSLVRATVVGEAVEGLERVMELALEYGGASSALAHEPGALAAAAGLSREEPVVEHAAGRGRRLVALSSCQVLAEEAELEGAWTLRREALGTADPSGFPERIEFRVRRGARRITGAEARAAEPMR